MRDAVIGPVWLLATLLLACAAWELAGKLVPGERVRARVMHTCVVAWAAIVSIAVLYGSVGRLSPPVMLGSVSAVAVLVMWVCRRKKAAELHQPRPEESAPAVETANGEISPERQTERGWSWAELGWLGVWGAACAWALSVTVVAGMLCFPAEWDTLNYHLPIIVQWLHQGSLYVHDDALWSVPANNEVLGFWLVGPFSGDFLIGLNNVPAVSLLVLATGELARQLRLSRVWMHLAGLAVLATWPVFEQLSDARNDVAVASLFMAVIGYGLRYARNGAEAHVVLGGVTVGLLAGIKFYALGYASVAGTGVVLLVLTVRGLKAAVGSAALLLLGAFLWGGYWYLRNIWLTGSPLYPQGFSGATDLLGQLRAHAEQTTVWQTSLLGNYQPEVLLLVNQAVSNLTGPCHALAFWLTPGICAWLIGSGFWLRSRVACSIDGTGRLWLVLWMLGTGLVWGCTPFAAEATAGTLDTLREGSTPVRYGLCFLNLSVLGLIVSVGDLHQGLVWLWSRAVPSRVVSVAGWSFGTGSVVRAAVAGLGNRLLPAAFAGAIVYQAYQMDRRVLRNSHDDLPDPLLLAWYLWCGGCSWACSGGGGRGFAQ